MKINILLLNNEKSGWILCIDPLQSLKPNMDPIWWYLREELLTRAGQKKEAQGREGGTLR